MPSRTSGRHMPEEPLSNPRKRRHSEYPSTHHVYKKQKDGHSIASQFPPAFWDNLSKIDLTKRALEELNRRNTRASLNPRPLSPRFHRPITRRFLTERNHSFPPILPTFSNLRHFGTFKNLKQTARHGGPDLSDLRGFPDPSDPLSQVMNLSRSSSRAPRQSLTSTPTNKPSTDTSKTTGPYNRNFQQNLIDHGVYPDGYEYPDGQTPPRPDNWEEINRSLSLKRGSLSPSRFSDEDFRKYKRADAHAWKEKQITTSVIPIIEGDVGDAKCVSGGIPFTNLDHLTDGTLVPGNPDVYYGARPEQLDRQVRDELTGQIIPSTQDELPIAPNFFVAAKGPDGTAAVANRQACYDGTLGARGMQSLQSYRRNEPVFDNKAYTISSTYLYGTLKMFTIHPTQSASPGRRPEYYMQQLRSFAMTDKLETFRDGATAFRNARDWAKTQRDQAIRLANKRRGGIQPAQDLFGAPSFTQISCDASETTVEENSRLSHDSRDLLTETSVTITGIPDLDTSCDELALDPLPVKRSNERSKQSSKSQRKRRNADDSDNLLFGETGSQSLEPSGLSQQFESQALQEPGSQTDGLQPSARGNPTRRGKSSSNKRKA